MYLENTCIVFNMEYILVFEKNDGANAIVRTSGEEDQVSEFIAKLFGSDPDIARCYISSLIKIIEVSVIDQEEPNVEVREENSNLS